MAIRVLVTDVTEMHAGNYCVAGWDNTTKRMVRPLPQGANWTSGLLTAHQIIPGVVIKVSPTGAVPVGSYPHRTEDLLINPNAINATPAQVLDWFGADAPTTAPT